MVNLLKKGHLEIQYKELTYYSYPRDKTVKWLELAQNRLKLGFCGDSETLGFSTTENSFKTCWSELYQCLVWFGLVWFAD